MKHIFLKVVFTLIMFFSGGVVLATCYTDCSDFVSKAYTQAGCSNPGSTSDSILANGDSDKSNLRAGDLIVRSGHVVMCKDDGCGTVIHAAGRKKGIVDANGSNYVDASDTKVVRASKFCNDCKK